MVQSHSSMSTCQKKFFLPFPDSDNVVSQSLNTWKNRNAKGSSGPKLLPLCWIGMNLDYYVAPNRIQSSFKDISWWKLAIAFTTTSLPTVLISMRACSLEACFTWTKIVSSASSILHGIKYDAPRPAPLVTTVAISLSHLLYHITTVSLT